MGIDGETVVVDFLGAIIEIWLWACWISVFVWFETVMRLFDLVRFGELGVRKRW